MLLLPKCVASVSKLCATENPRHAITGVRVTDPGDGTFRVDATDGHVAAIVTGPCDDTKKYPHIDDLARAPDWYAGGVIPSSDWNAVFKSVPKHRQHAPTIYQNVAVVVGKDQATLATTEGNDATVIAPQLVQGRFPAIDDVFPSKKPASIITIDARYMRSIMDVVCSVTVDDEKPTVTLEIIDADSPITFRAVNKEKGVVFNGLLMPLSAERRVTAEYQKTPQAKKLTSARPKDYGHAKKTR